MSYLEKRIFTIKKQTGYPAEPSAPLFKPLQWTDSKVALIELIYALKQKVLSGMGKQR